MNNPRPLFLCLLVPGEKVDSKFRGDYLKIMTKSAADRPKKILRLYVWKEVEALADWYPGVAFALAESKEQAISLIMNNAYDLRKDKETCEEKIKSLRDELASVAPVVCRNRAGFSVSGGG